MKEERFPHTRKTFHWWRWRVAGGAGKLQSHEGERGNRSAQDKVERFPHRGSVPTSTHQLERLVCSPTGVSKGWELRLGLRSDCMDRTGVG